MLVYTLLYSQLIVSDPVHLRYKKGTVQFHPITAFVIMYANFKNIFLISVFWFKYIFPIKFQIPIFDKLLFKKNSVSFEVVHDSILSIAFQ